MELGFTGLGIMGIPMTTNLTHADHQLHVTAIGPVVNELPSLSVISVETARQVADALDIIFTMAPDIPQAEDVLFGGNGCTKASLEGKTIADISSISPIKTRHFARQVDELGGDYLDTPISGGGVGACEGTSSVMVGGDKAVSERAKPLFELLGKNITLVGGNGDDQTCKMANQIIMALNIETVSKALLFAPKASAGPVCARQALMGGFVSSYILEVHGECMIRRTFNPSFKVVLHQKDLNLTLQSIKALTLNLPNTVTCQELFNTCMTNGGSQLGHSALV